MRWRGYDSEIWGLTRLAMVRPIPCRSSTAKSAASSRIRRAARRRLTSSMTARLHRPQRSPRSPFAPEIVIPTIRAFRARFGEHLYQKYGFLDAVNPSFTFTDVPLRHGTVDRRYRLGRE